MVNAMDDNEARRVASNIPSGRPYLICKAIDFPMPRRFPYPWAAERIPGGYVVKDATGQARHGFAPRHQGLETAGCFWN